MQRQTTQRKILLNAGRVAGVGGLHAFTAAVMRCLAADEDASVTVLVSGETEVPPGLERVEAPRSLTMRGSSSWLRSLGGYGYAVMQSWRYRHWRVLSTTHLGLPGHCHQILTVHDVRPHLMPDTWAHTVYYRFMLPRALRRAEGVLTVSQASKDAIVRTYGIAPEKIHVVPNVARTVKLPVESAAERRELPYLLMVNATYRHKNAGEFLEQHGLWRGRYRVKILAGEGRYREELRAQARRLGLAEMVDFLPAVTEEELAGLYANAAALVYPSLLEGFGLPPVEAMAYGTPAIVSDIPVFREVLGDAPLYVRLGDAASWQRALEGIDEALRPERVERARRLAGQYTQERMSEALRTALRAIWPD